MPIAVIAAVVIVDLSVHPAGQFLFFVDVDRP
jgi:hypothetical protein